jgi:hypothetical protein
MEGLVCVALPGIGLVTLLIYCCVVGVRALRGARQASGEHAGVLRMIGLNLCEPIAGTPLVLLTLYFLQKTSQPNVLLFGLAAVWPMWSLLLPIGAIAYHNARYRQAGLKLFWLGTGRIFCNALSLGVTIGWAQLGEASNVLLVPALIAPFASLGLLIYAVRWARAQLDGPLCPPLPPVVPIVNPTPTIISIATAARPAAAPLLRPAPTSYLEAAPCPLCRALVRFDDGDCPECGLVFASRLPAELLEVPRYTVLRQVGGGGMSSIYLARDRAIGEICVIKAVVSAEASDAAWRAEALGCLEREAAALRDLHHPGIVRLLGWYPEGHAPFLAIEYVSGASLEARLDHRLLSHGEALRHAASVADTLCYLAARPLVHCDIKPANLALPEAGGPTKLLDFGSAMLPGVAQGSGNERYGTPGYAAPEQYSGAASPRSDVYGLAATLYHLLTGDDPTGHPLAFPALGMLPAEIAAALNPALDRSPEERPDPAAFRASLWGLAGRYP